MWSATSCSHLNVEGKKITQTEKSNKVNYKCCLAVWTVSVVTNEEEPRPGLEEVWIIFKVPSCNKLYQRVKLHH